MSVFSDLRIGARLLARDRGCTAAAVLVLAVGIGVCNTAFTMLTGMFFQAIPIAGAERLTYVDPWEQRGGRSGASWEDFSEWQASARSFEELGGYRLAPVTLTEGERLPEQYRGMWMTPNIFALLRQKPVLGRGFSAADGQAGAERVALISYDLWQARYGGSRSVVGRAIGVDGIPTTIVGVMPEGMDFEHRREVWTPATGDSELRRAGARDLIVVGRLADGVSLDTARAETAVWSDQLAERRGGRAGDYTVRLTTFGDRILGADQRTGYSVLAGAVAFVLLICCANVANLLIARSGRRLPDIAIRLALGATRWRIVRQLLLETTLLATAGGVLGLALSYVGVDYLREVVEAAPDRPFWVHIGFDPRVFVFLFVVSLAAGLTSGIAPAWLVSGARITRGLQEKGSGVTQGTSARRLARLMVAGQLAMTVVLLTGAGLLVRTFAEMYRVDLGVDAESVLTAKVRLPQATYADLSARRDFYDRLEARLSDVPGGMAASFANAAPLEQRTLRRVVVDQPGARGDDGAAHVLVVFVGSRYFEALGVGLRRGRTFDPLDGTTGREAAIVSEGLARTVRGGDPIGRRLRFVEGGTAEESSAPPTIVGIAPDIRQNPLFWKGTARVVYLPFRSGSAAEAVVLARSSSQSAALLTPVVRDCVRGVDRNQAIYEVKTLSTRVEESAGPFRALGSIFGFLGAIGLVMAATGMYATVAWTIDRRRREAGIRLALGADRARLSWLFASSALADTALGLAVGLVGSVGLGFLLRSIVTTSPVDLPTLAGVCGVLASVTALAAWLPLRRALQLDPAEIVRSE